MMHVKDETDYWILSFLSKTDSPLGAGFLLEEIRRKDINVSEATVGRHLRAMRSDALLVRMGNQGHCITENGRKTLDRLEKERGLMATLGTLISEQDGTGLDSLIGVLIARRALEREAVIQATINANDDELLEIEDIIKKQYEKTQKNEDYAEISKSFHESIFRFSHVPLLETLHNFIGISTKWQRFFVGMFTTYNIPTNIDHERIFRAMKARDPESAAILMSSHIDDVIRNAKNIAGSYLIQTPQVNSVKNRKKRA
jgi:GntR family L-lactate dehydrogenase operon transcriptional regulator